MTIDKYFDGKEVLVTGATGLMGKALVEKILRSCPGVSKVYVIIRPRRGCDPKDRWASTVQSPLFNSLRNSDPQSLSKVVVVPGDGAEDNFGISERDRKMLIDNVSIVYHGAASINFFNDITRALRMNLKSTYSLLELAKEMKKIECFTLISTAYCNFNLKGKIEEKVYEQHYDWRLLLELIKDEKSSAALKMLEPRLLKGHLTTYTITKAMSEVAVRDYNKHFPTIIVRPALVSGSLKDPIPGWFDTDNFITLYARGVRMGVLRCVPITEDTIIEMVPLDVSVRAILVSTWKRSIQPTETTDVYCHRLAGKHRFTLQDTRHVKAIFADMPSPNALWYNFEIFAPNPILYGILYFFLHVISGFLLDEALKFSGQKSRLKKVYTEIWRYNELARYYSKPHHEFLSNNFEQLESYVPKDDKTEFSIDYSDFDKFKNLKETSLCVMKHSWKENVGDEKLLEKSRKRYRMLTILHFSLCAIGVFILVKALWPLFQFKTDSFRIEDPISTLPVTQS